MVQHPSGDLDRVFAALADPTRRAIVERLADGEASVSDLAAPFDMSLTAVSKHVGVLEDAGLVDRRRVGRERRCRLKPHPLHEAHRWTNRYRRFWETRLDALDEYLREQDDQ